MTTDPRDAPPPVASADPPPRYSPATTALYAIMWAYLTLQAAPVQFGEGPAIALEYPEWSAGRMVSRDLEMAEAVDTSPASWWPWGDEVGDFEAALSNGIAIHYDILSTYGLLDEAESRSDGSDLEPDGPDLGAIYLLPGDRTRAQLAVLLAESGDVDEALRVARGASNGEVFAAILEEAHGRRPATGANTAANLASHELDDWMAARLSARLARQRGEAVEAEAIEAAVVERGAARLSRAYATSVVHTSLILAGVAIVGVWGSRRYLPRPPPRRAFPAPWSLATGIGVLIRADFWFRFYFLAVTTLAAEATGTAWEPLLNDSWLSRILFDNGTLMASIPLFVLVWRNLLAPLAPSRRDVFGFRPKGSEVPILLGLTAAAVALDLAGTQLLSIGTWKLGYYGHWSEGFDEGLIWGLAGEAALAVLDLAVWSPGVEELTYRGVLYYSLRRRFGPATAATASALFFGAIHFYSLPGFLVTFWSGFVWALVFERFHSLLPGIAAHSIYNLFYVAGLVLIYR